MPSPSPAVAQPPDPQLLRDVLDGLAASPPTLPSKYFYDEEGSRLFDRITALEAYYPTRTEQAILDDNLDAIADHVGPGAVLLEYGSGSSAKTRILLDRLAPTLAAYVPIDISEDYLLATAERLRQAYPGLPVLPVAADYTRAFALPDLPPETRRRVVFFPGSTIGNFTPAEAADFLVQAAETAGAGGALLIGVDQQKDPAVLERAYNDEEGVTAAFNLNVLHRINRDLGGDADLEAWAHEAVYDPDRGRIEMHLRSLRAQTLHVCGRAFSFEAGETIHTENSYKYAITEFQQLATQAGFTSARCWFDDTKHFSVHLFRRN
ncbi:MAG TPA: L-histidine N(alpha)-methyltransferase [Gammaproteobacteria bacterium]|nr:L-histidine N(alpha)-methyltransferase [Gammaproteobacteria bacterium]